MFRNDASEFVYIRTYARWFDDKGRREVSWAESAQRLLGHYWESCGDKIPKKVRERVEYRVLKMDAMPSMRALWSAGPALKANSILGYNCAYLPITDLFSFAELLYILMCGTGVGFSVEKYFIDKLPPVALQSGLGAGVHVVADSKEGWAASLYEGLKAWFTGKDIEFDYTKVRPRGARLMTMGGRASGPEPLRRLHRYVKGAVLFARGRRLTPIECHDICCMVAEVVVVGGVRRSSMISFSDLGDEDMREAKDPGTPVYRAMANNSAAYESKPDILTFMAEWINLAKSGSGERGIFNAEAAVKYAPRRGLKVADKFRTNPCFTGSQRLMTEAGPLTFEELCGRKSVGIYVPRDGAAVSMEGIDVRVTGTEQRVFLLSTREGYEVEATPDHKFLTPAGWAELSTLSPGDRVAVGVGHPCYGKAEDGDGRIGELLGWWQGDGTSWHNGDKYALDFWGKERVLADRMVDTARDALGIDILRNDVDASDKTRIYGRALSDAMRSLGARKGTIPGRAWRSSEFARGYLRGLFSADGTVNIVAEKQRYAVRLSSVDRALLVDIQRLLGALGIASRILLRRGRCEKVFPTNSPNGPAERTYACKPYYDVVVYGENILAFRDHVGFLQDEKAARLTSVMWTKGPYTTKRWLRVRSVEQIPGLHTVYCVTEPVGHTVSVNGIAAHNCGEIVLRPRGFCNLTEVVVRSSDTFDDLVEKVDAAVWMGAMQSTWTNFPFIRAEWKANCEAERLLGVSLTGQLDNPGVLTAEKLEILRDYAIKTAKKACSALGISASVAVTCVKPSGTVSQVVDCASGCHPRWSEYYIRRYRISSTDPLFRMMRDQGVKFEAEVGQRPGDWDRARMLCRDGMPFESVCPLYERAKEWSEDRVQTWVVSFPVKSPVKSIVRKDWGAIQQLEWYRRVQKNWCEHNVSCTVYVPDGDWLKVGNWVYENFDDIVGISFLPADGGSYDMAPYEEIDKDRYEKMKADFKKIDYTQLSRYELEDQTTGAQTLACTGNVCEIV